MAAQPRHCTLQRHTFCSLHSSHLSQSILAPTNDMSASGAAASKSQPLPPAGISPAVYVLLRYAVASPQEYKALYGLLQTRAPKHVSKRAVDPAAYAAASQGKDDFNPAAVRAALRVFLVSRAGLGLYDALLAFLRRRRGGAAK